MYSDLNGNHPVRRSSRTNGHNGSTSATSVLTLERPIVPSRDHRPRSPVKRSSSPAAKACACGRTRP